MRRKLPTGPGAPPLQATVAEMRALAHPLRLRILELFAEAPRTTKQVADLLGEPPTRLYHHVAALQRAGLLRLTKTRKNRGTTEKWFEAIARTMGSTTAVRSTRAAPREEAAARRAVAMAVLEQSRQEVVSSMSRANADRPLLARLVMVAPPAQLAELRERLMRLLRDVQRDFACEDGEPNEGSAATPRDDAERWAVTITFAPTSGR
jgi:DNA-binding transcriptional ArsR family regulator